MDDDKHEECLTNLEEGLIDELKEKKKFDPHTKPKPPTGKPELSDFGITLKEFRSAGVEPYGLGPLILSIWFIGAPVLVLFVFVSAVSPDLGTLLILGGVTFFIVVNWKGFSGNPSNETLKAVERYKEAKKDYDGRYRAYEKKLRDYELNQLPRELRELVEEMHENVEAIDKTLQKAADAELISELQYEKAMANLKQDATNYEKEMRSVASPSLIDRNMLFKLR